MPDGLVHFIEDQTGGLLGRHINHDPKNRNYPVRGVLWRFDEPVHDQEWGSDVVFNQGASSSCTANSAVGILNTSPNRESYPQDLPLYDDETEIIDLYRAAQKKDPYPDDTPYEGSSTDAPFIELRDRGQIAEWRWSFGYEDVLRTLTHWGPVGIGTNWHEGMMKPVDGYLIDTGEVVGGHAYRLTAVYWTRQEVEMVNSWGPEWGNNGRALIKFDVLERLLANQGEAVTIVLQGVGS